MRNVRMPGTDRIVTVYDKQCGKPVRDGWDGDDSYHPCALTKGHAVPLGVSSGHSSNVTCPQSFEHAIGGRQECSKQRWHRGKCANNIYLATDTYGEGEDELQPEGKPVEPAAEPWHIVEGVQSAYIRKAAMAGTPLVAMCGKNWTQTNTEPIKAEDVCISCAQHFIIAITHGSR